MQVYPVNFMARDASVSLARSFREIGFALLTNHSINRNLIKESHQEWKNFFRSEDKYNFQYDQKKLDGYFAFGIEKARAGKGRDLKEFFYYYSWGKCPLYLKEKTAELYNELVLICTTLLQQAEEYLPNDIRAKLCMPLVKMVEKTPRAVLRILHYPPIEKDDGLNLAERAKEGAMRAIEHEDLTLVSAVMPLVGSGLQLKDLAGNWHSIPPGTENLIINIGDMLEMCSRGFYKATTHRVVNPTDEEAHQSRYANAFFMNPLDEVQLDDEHTALSCLTGHINKKLDSYEAIPVVET
jgi:isopenicillin N synthase-like dioxygenase